ncbi:sugar specific permease [Pediococcus cellicola]|uniref:Sugar specific permease n=1 Tax=Pediococcus cellicola TaxID=319652 RepID=A0A0R2IYS6_9LACO|nr:sugar specific permease [Pediococcus cellicola]
MRALERNTTLENNDWGKRWSFLGLSLLINATGHSITIVMNLGSAVWTASAVNLYHMWPLSLRATLFLCGVVVVLMNALLIQQFNWKRIIGNLLFTFPFSYLIQLFTQVISKTGINQLPLSVRIITDVFGILCVALATSIYQRANIILHPNDDFMQIIRFKYMNGNATLAQMIHYIPPVIIMLITFVMTKHLWAVNIGTLICLFFQGTFIGFFDKHVFLNLKHYGLHVIK